MLNKANKHRQRAHELQFGAPSVELESLLQVLEDALQSADTNSDEAISKLIHFKQQCQHRMPVATGIMKYFLHEYCALTSFTNPSDTLKSLATQSIVTDPDHCKFFLSHLLPEDKTKQGWQELRTFLNARGLQVVATAPTCLETIQHADRLVIDMEHNVMRDLHGNTANRQLLSNRSDRTQVEINHRVKFMQMFALQTMINRIFPNQLDLATFHVQLEMYSEIPQSDYFFLHYNWQDMAIANNIDGPAIVQIIKEHSRHEPSNNRFIPIADYATNPEYGWLDDGDGPRAEEFNPVTQMIRYHWDGVRTESKLTINRVCCNDSLHFDIKFHQYWQAHDDGDRARILELEKPQNHMRQYPDLGMPREWQNVRIIPPWDAYQRQPPHRFERFTPNLKEEPSSFNSF